MNASADRWREIDKILREALEVPPHARQALVQRRCGEDRELRGAVERLLQAADNAGDFLEASPEELAGASWDEIFDTVLSLHSPLEGERVDGYRLVRQIGRGGLGTVYLAKRVDPDLPQRVALKIVRRGLDTDDILARFRVERRILASMEHPAIAKLLDAGTTPDGRPYLVMEYIEGQAITTFCDRHRLAVRERLRLFVQAAEAVQYAHRHLVIHRDLKPSNILVTHDRHVKLLDFGIAKVLDPDDDTGIALTRTGERPLTPDYASPEQLLGEPVTTASDVYQLGLLLFELLTGQRARHSTRPSSADETTRGKRNSSPPRLGTAVGRSATTGDVEFAAAARSTTPRRLRRQLVGDLETIVGTAIRAEPERRYATAEQMAQDVRLHLQGRPVTARPDAWTYRLRKLVQRRPWIAPAAALTLVMGSAYGVTRWRYATELEVERNIAVEEAAKAQQVQDFMVELFRSPDPLAPADPDRGARITVQEVLALGTRRVRAELEGRPAVQASLLAAVSDVYTSLDLVPAARELREEVLRLETEAFGPGSEEAVVSLRKLGSLTDDDGDPDSALVLLERQLQLARDIYGRDHIEVARSLRTLGKTHLNRGNLESSEAAVTEAVRILRAQDPVPDEDLTAALWNLASILPDMGRTEEAVAAAREALELVRERHGDGHVRTAIAHVYLAGVLDDVGRSEDAVQEYRNVLPVLAATLGIGHSITSRTMNNLAVSLDRVGDYGGAEEVHRRVLAEMEERFGPSSRAAAESLQNLGVVLGKQRRYAEAAATHRRAHRAFVASLPSGHYLTAFPLLSLAEILLAQGDFQDALDASTEAAEILRASLPEAHFATAMAECRRARALLGLSRSGAAEVLLREAVPTLEADPSVRPAYRMECRQALARARGIEGS